MAGDTFLFADIVGFTSFTERHGDDAAADLAARFRAGVEAILPKGARLVKTMGDAVMVRLDDPAEAAATAVRIARSALGADDPPVRIGVHSGTAVERDGDFFGAAVNIAARVAAFARPGEALVTPEVAEAAQAFGLATADLGERRLRNVFRPVHVLALREEPALKPVEGVAA
jgi:adenylate cyclase